MTRADPVTVDTARLPLLLSELRLPTVNRLWTPFAERAEQEGWPPARFLAALLEHELAERHQRRIQRHLQDARLPPGKSFATFDFAAVPSLGKARILALGTGGSWLDCGMFIQSVMIAARAYELHTCPQAAFTPFHRIVRRHVGIPDGEILLCGMALGHIDLAEPANALNTEREPVGVFTRFCDDERAVRANRAS